MKYFSFVICLFVGMNLFGQPPVQFKEVKHDFGKIKKNVPATYVFSFSNQSVKPVIIESAVAECGCTTPVYDNKPILKGKTSDIKVTYNAATPGTFTKKVTVKFANQAQPYILTIEGEVVDKK